MRDLKTYGVVPATYYDWVAMGHLIGLEIRTQLETLDADTGDPLYINRRTGQPGTSNTPIVAVGKSTINAVVYWLEKKAKISPVYYQLAYSRYYFRRSIDGSVIVYQYMSASIRYDHFVIYTVTDAAGNTYYVFYGFRWRGSWAASRLLTYWVQKGELASHTSSYEVWKWHDTRYNNKVDPPGVDTYTLIASG